MTKAGSTVLVVSQVVLVTIGVGADGWRDVRPRKREVPRGFAVGDSEEGAFRTAFLRTLNACGLHGLQLVTSDTQEGQASMPRSPPSRRRQLPTISRQHWLLRPPLGEYRGADELRACGDKSSGREGDVTLVEA